MKAPDKIYIDDLAVVNDCFTKNSTKPLPNFSEYIRKDALLEWAKEQKKECEQVIREHPEDGSLWLERDKYDELIDKLNSM